MLYVIHALDAPEVAAKRAASRPAHLERLKALHEQGRMVLVGPMPKIDAPSLEGGVTGSLIVAEFESLEAAREWMANDAYVKAGVYASIDIRPFFQVKL